jgi:HEAT repeat protein
MAESDATPADGGGRIVRPLLAIFLAAAVLLAIGVGCWYYLRRQANLRDGEALSRLTRKQAIEVQPLTDSEFEQALALTESADWEVRSMALNTAAASVRGWGGLPPRPNDAGRVISIAARLLSDPDTRVRRIAIKTLSGLKAKEYVEQIRSLTGVADRDEREAAEAAIRKLATETKAETSGP